MNRDLIRISLKMLKGYQKQAEEQALAVAQWRAKLGAIESELLEIADKHITFQLERPVEIDDDNW